LIKRHKRLKSDAAFSPLGVALMAASNGVALSSSNPTTLPTMGWPTLGKKNSPLFELARLLVRFNHVASFIVNPNRNIV
jgi:imidazoleglycerol phosphate synthase glutamine amidotransferase subunit HisH